MPSLPCTPEGETLRSLIAQNLRADLSQYLRGVARATVLGVALAACNTSHAGPGDGGTDAEADTAVLADGAPPSPPPPHLPMFCDPANVDYFDGIAPELASFKALIGSELGYGYDAPIFYEVVSTEGEECAGAMDPAGCGDELTRLLSDTRERALVFTDVDGAHVITSPEEALAMLGGEVTTAGGAALLVHLGGYDVRCVAPSTTVPGGFDVLGVMEVGGGATCMATVTEARLAVDPDGSMREVDSVSYDRVTCPVGRRPAGLAPAAERESVTPVADLFAEITRLEASAVAAFDLMIDELTELGAPPSLIDAAREAREDEVRHTESMGELSRVYGAEPAEAVVGTPKKRSAFEIALENAVEGCVRETYGALVAAHQALKAHDPRVARTMAVVADDEIRHAELSWAVASWLEPRLTDEERAQIRQAKRLAIWELSQAASTPTDDSIIRLAGMPDCAAHAAMVARLAEDIWS